MDNAVNDSPDYTATEARIMEAEGDASRQNLLRAVDGVVQGTLDNPLEQLSVLMLACAMACRRVIVMAANGDNIGLNRAIRMRLIKTAVGEFEKKLRRFCSPLTVD